MQYDHILIRYGEMALKGKNRKHFTKQLEYNVKDQIRPYPKAKIERTRDRMYIHLHGEKPEPIVEACRNIFGIHSFSLAIRTENEEWRFNKLHCSYCLIIQLEHLSKYHAAEQIRNSR